jgi:hypothetical protein
MMRDAAIAWLRGNCNEPETQAHVIGWLDVAVSIRRNCAFAIGSSLTAKHCPYLLNWFNGELFIFELERRQAAALGLGDADLKRLIDSVEVRQGPPFPPLMSLEGVELQTPVISRPNQPIVCSCDYRLLRSPMEIVFLMTQMGMAPSGAAGMSGPSVPFPFGYQAPQGPPWMHDPALPGYPPRQPCGFAEHQPHMPGQPHMPHLPPMPGQPYTPNQPHMPGQPYLPLPHMPGQLHGYPQHAWNQQQFEEHSYFEHGTAYAFQLQLTVPGKGVMTFYSYPDQFLTARGKLTLVFNPIGDSLTGATPVTAAFVSCCNRVPSSCIIPESRLSNPAAILLEIEPAASAAPPAA